MKGILLFFLLAVAVAAEGQVVFQKMYSPATPGSGASVIQTSDGGYMLTGVGQDSGAQGGVLLMKTDSLGDIEWTRSYNDSGTWSGYSVQQTFDRGFIVAGDRTRNIQGVNIDLYLVKTDSIGDTLWTRAYDIGYHDIMAVVRPTADSGYAIAGDADYDIALIKTDKNGNVVWSQVYRTYDTVWPSQPNEEHLFCMETTKDGGYVLGGIKIMYYTHYYYGYLIKADSVGNVLWSKAYSDTNRCANCFIQSILQDRDGGYSIGVNNYYYSMLLKTDSKGEVIWSKYYSASYASLIHTKDSGYAMANGVGIMKMDSLGDTLWVKKYQGFVNQLWYGESVLKQTSDGGFILIGSTWDSLNAYRIALIKTDANGNSTCNVPPSPFIYTGAAGMYVSDTNTYWNNGHAVLMYPLTAVGTPAFVPDACLTIGIKEVEAQNSARFFPNPFHTLATLEADFRIYSLEIYDVMGRRVRQQIINQKTTILNREDLPVGLYFYHLRTKDSTAAVNGKFVVE